MAEQNFVDYVKILFRSGKGGAGSVHFFRGPAMPMGGPDGGDGGRGGHIILEANPQEWTLLSLKYTKHIFASDGQGGRGGLKTGSDGKDIVVKVPLGTVARDAETGEVLMEITETGQRDILFAGGRGGKGNTSKALPTKPPCTPNRAKKAPRFGLFWNSKCWPMWALWDSPMQAKAPC
jgi:GTPase